MPEPSVLEYARYFGLTEDFTQIDPLSHLNFVTSTNSKAANSTPEADSACKTFLERCEQAVTDYVNLVGDHPFEPSKEVSDLLQRCSPPSQSEVKEIIKDLLVDHRGVKKYKMPLPLLLIGGGDVEKDARRVRKGIDFDQILDDIREDWEDIDREKEKKGRKKRNLAPTVEDALHVVQYQLELRTKEQQVAVSRNTLKYLQAVMSSPDSRTRRETICNTLSHLQPRLWCVPGDLKEDEFPVDADEDLGERRTELEVGQVNIASENADMRSLSSEDKPGNNDIQTLDDAASIVEISKHSPSSQDESHPDELFSEFINEDMVTPNTSMPESSYVTEHLLETWSQNSKEKDSNAGNISQDDTSGLTPDTATMGQAFLSISQQHKISAIELQPYTPRLPTIQTVDLMDQTCALSTPANTGTRNVLSSEDLPLEPLSIQEILKREKGPDSMSMGNFFNCERPVLTSRQLMWKEPGLRILDEEDDGERGDLEPDDYSVDDLPSNVKTKQDSALPFEDLETPVQCLAHSDYLIEHDKWIEALADEVNLSQLDAPFSSSQKLKSSSPAQVPDPSGEVETKSKSSNIDLSELTTDRVAASIQSTDIIPQREKMLLSASHSFSRLLGIDDGDSQMSFDRGNSLSNFLELKGKQFRFRKPSTPDPKVVEITEDPISSTQSSIIKDDKNAQQSEPKTSAIPFPTVQEMRLPAISPLSDSRTIMLNNALLQHKPILIRFLEDKAATSLRLIYRDLNNTSSKGPDLILNPTTCVLITNLQALSQRPLPGQQTKTGLSTVHDQTYMLSQTYAQVFIVIPQAVTSDISSQTRSEKLQMEFASFCRSISKSTEGQESHLVPLWVPCASPATTADTVNAWIWTLVKQYGYSSRGTWHLRPERSAALISDETVWELLLVQAGLNPLAAQVAIGVVKVGSQPKGLDTTASWGLRRLISMSAADRHKLLDHLIGVRAVHRLTQAIST